MARGVSLLALRTRALQLATVENDPNIQVADVNALINLYIGEFYDIVVSGGGQADYYSSTWNVQTQTGIISYPLPEDFLKLTRVFAQESPDLLRPIYPINDIDRQRMKSPQGSWPMVVEYIPVAPTLQADTDTFDGINGWDQLVVAMVARDIRTKREADTSAVNQIILMMEKRIRSYSTSRDLGGPKYLFDVEEAYVWPRSVRIDGYRLRAGALEFYTSVWGWP